MRTVDLVKISKLTDIVRALLPVKVIEIGQEWPTYHLNQKSTCVDSAGKILSTSSDRLVAPMPQQFSIKSILLLTTATALAIVLLSPIIAAAMKVGLYFSFASILGTYAFLATLLSVFPLFTILWVLFARIVTQERSRDRLALFGFLILYCVALPIGLFEDLDLGYMIAVFGVVLTILGSITLLLWALIIRDKDRRAFAGLSLIAASIEWLMSSTYLWMIYSRF